MTFNTKDEGDGVVVLSFFSPMGNSLNTAQILEMAEVIDACGRQPGLRALIVTGENGNFCRGRIGAKGLTLASAVAEDLGAILKVNAAFDALDVPVITAIEGEAFGFAFGLTAQSDYAIAAENAVFALPEMSHGLPPLIVLTYLFRFVPYKRAMELSLSSRKISAQEAQTAGILTEVVEPGGALSRAVAVAKEIAEKDRQSVALLRRFSRQVAGAHSPTLSENAVATMSILLSERALVTAK